MKPTLWIELAGSECHCIAQNIGADTGTVLNVQLKHPLLKRARWFVRSQAGNWYSRYTKKEQDAYGEGYIVRGDVVLS